MNVKSKIKKGFISRKFKLGGMQTLQMVLVLAIVVVVNLVAGKMNLTVDLSSDKIYTLTDSTKKLTEGLKEDVTIYYMCQAGQETDAIEKVLDQYDKLSHVSVEEKDPIVYPNFSKQYTDETITGNDIIVVNAKENRSKFVAYSDMVQSSMDYSTYSQSTTLDAEGQITAAIQSVTTTDSKKVYYTQGHGEQTLDTEFTSLLSKANMTATEWKSQAAQTVPSDCDLVLMNGPAYDLSQDEYNLLNQYMQKGGRMILFLNATADSQPRLKKLMKNYGLNAVDGYVVDSTQCYSSQYPTILAPTVGSHDITKDASDTQTLIMNAVGMTTGKSDRDTLTVTSLLDTSDSSFSRTDKTASSLEKIDSDIQGPFSVAAIATETVKDKDNNEKQAQFIVFGSYTFQDQTFIGSNQFGNRSILLNTLSQITGSETSSLAIPARSLDTQTVTIQASDRVYYTTLLVVVVPLLLLAAGFIIWNRRRKR
ncbi:MAG: GldG family protein [Eubacterium sp.]|nr:GldG family protein [Eubacterium sp.]